MIWFINTHSSMLQYLLLLKEKTVSITITATHDIMQFDTINASACIVAPMSLQHRKAQELHGVWITDDLHVANHAVLTTRKVTSCLSVVLQQIIWCCLRHV